MTIYTMGFTQKDAKTFFSKIRENEIQILIDIRLNNQSQLAGFTKGRDLEYLLSSICNCLYSHEVLFAPDKQLLDDYKKGRASWQDYEKRFNALITGREVEKIFKEKYSNYERVLFLCSEPTAEKCHRRLMAEYISRSFSNIQIKHI